MNKTIIKYGKPEIMNTNQRSQFTGKDWSHILADAKIKVLMERRERYLDNFFIERPRRSLKQEAVYLHELHDGIQAKCAIKD